MNARREGPPVPAGAEIDPLELIGFLRGRDFRFGTGEALRAVALFERLAEEGRAPATVDEAALWLAPILCVSGRQQAVLRERVQAFVTRAAPAPAPHGEVGEPPLGSARLPEPPRTRRRALVAIAGVVVLVALLALIFFAGSAGVGEGDVVGTTLGVLRGADILKAPMLLVAAMLPLAWRLYLVQRSRAKHARIGRRPYDGGATTQIEAARGGFVSFDDLSLARAFQGLRTHRKLESQAIDARASVRATLAACGQPRLVRGHRPTQPTYPIVVEAASSRDHVVDLARALAARLREESVDHSLFFSSADPRWLRDESGSSTTLADLSARYRQDVLLFVGDGEGLRDATHGGVRTGLGIDEWRTVILLTPVPRERWSWRERRLAEAGLIVLPATAEGLNALGDFLRSEGRRPLFALERPPAPRGLLTGGRRGGTDYHGDEPPEPGEREALLDMLAMDLTPPAFELLCVLAVYPELRPDLTRFVAARLDRPDGKPLIDGAAFGAIAALPWCRAGRMPDWLRLDLARELRPARAEQARGLFAAWLGSGGGETVEITPETLGKLAAGAARAPGSPLRDALFLRFCEGGNFDELDMDAPERVLDEIAPHAVRRAFWGRVLAYTLAPLAGIGALVLPLVDPPSPGSEALLVLALILADLAAFGVAGMLLQRAARGREPLGTWLGLVAMLTASLGALPLAFFLRESPSAAALALAGPALAMALLPFAPSRAPASAPVEDDRSLAWAPVAAFLLTVAMAATAPPFLLSLALAVITVHLCQSPALRADRQRALILTGVGALLVCCLALPGVSLSESTALALPSACFALLAALFGGTLAHAVVEGRGLRLLAVGQLVGLFVAAAYLVYVSDTPGDASFELLLLLPFILLVPLEWSRAGSLRQVGVWSLAVAGTLFGVGTAFVVRQLGDGAAIHPAAVASAGWVIAIVYGIWLGTIPTDRMIGRGALMFVATSRPMPSLAAPAPPHGNLVRGMKRAFSFRGRAGRMEVLIFVAVNWVVVAFAALLPVPFNLVVQATTYIPVLTSLVRRLHDLGWSGRWMFLAMAIIAGAALVSGLSVVSTDVASLMIALPALVMGGLLLLVRGNKDANRFGPPPEPLFTRRAASA